MPVGKMNFEREGAASAAPTSSLKKIMKLARQAADLEVTISDLTEVISKAQSRLTHLKTMEIPDAMSEAQLSEFRMEDGTLVTAEDFVAGSIPKDPEKRQKAVELLEAYGGGGLIKPQLRLVFSKSDNAKAIKLFQQLQKKGLPVEYEASVHAQSLMAFGRERLRNGEATDFPSLGLFVGRIAKFKLPKEKKGKKNADA